MTWKVITTMTQRYEFCTRANKPGCNISRLCRQFKISRTVGYKWLRRFQTAGYDGLFDESRRPRCSPRRLPQEVEQAVIDLRMRYPVWGPRKLSALLKDHLPSELIPSVSTIARILKRYGLTETAEPEPVWSSVGRFERLAPNELWQMDLKAAIRLEDRRKIYPVGIIDDYSRYLIGLRMVPDVTDQTVLSCWIRAAEEYGLPESVLTDHGAQFRMEDEQTSSFRVYLWGCGVRHTQGRVRHPQTQGKIERLWETLKRELLSREHYRDPASWQRRFDDWRYEYNHIRPHQELGDRPPASRYRASERRYSAPDRRAWSGGSGAIPRRVDDRGQISLNGHKLLIGRGFGGWTVEVRPLGNGCWHVYFRDHFVREIVFAPFPDGK